MSLTPDQRRAYNARRRAERRAEREAERAATAGPRGANGETYTLTIRCPYCAGALEEINQRAMRSELVGRLTCKNPKCAHELVIRVQLGSIMVDAELEPTRCGTATGAQRHYRRGEPLCDPCREARNRAVQDAERVGRRTDA